MTQTETNSVHEDFQWILRILDSSKNYEHLNCTLKCFKLWEMKNIDKFLTKIETNRFNDMKNIFWVKFKNKNSNVGIINLL